jgi:hypothetical protein
LLLSLTLAAILITATKTPITEDIIEYGLQYFQDYLYKISQ